MMVRVLGEGQYCVEGGTLDRLLQMEKRLEEAVVTNDETEFHAALNEVVSLLREEGESPHPGHLGESELVVPPADYTLAEARELLGGGEKEVH